MLKKVVNSFHVELKRILLNLGVFNLTVIANNPVLTDNKTLQELDPQKSFYTLWLD